VGLELRRTKRRNPKGKWLVRYHEPASCVVVGGGYDTADASRRAVAEGLSRDEPSPQGKLTQHALMVAWGEFAIELGLIDKLREISIPQKSVVHTPQAKVLTFLMGTLCGITHLKDLNEGPHPLAHDWGAIRAWGLCALPHYSGVSRTLAACDESTVSAITSKSR